MKSILLTFATLLNIVFAVAQLPAEANTYYTQLIEINKEWQHYPSAIPKGEVTFETDADRIQLHLNLVINHLKNHPPKNLTASQNENRTQLLVALEDYAAAKTFPTNLYHQRRTPYFVDDYGVHCAVGQLMHVSGHDELVQKIRKDFNYNYLADIKTAGIAKWSKKYGFTIDELKWIQPGYGPTAILSEVGNGVNGPIHKIEKDWINNRIVLGGQFTEIGQLPCLNIGVYANNQLSCLGAGLEGQINDIQATSTALYAFGLFPHNGQAYAVAKFDGVSWTYIAHNTYGAPVAECAITNSIGIEVALKPNAQSSNDELWFYSFTNSSWSKLGEVNGVIKDIDGTATTKAYVGHFSTFTPFTLGIPNTPIPVTNVVLQDLGSTFYGIGAEVSDTVNVVKAIGSVFYFGGACSQTTDEVCLTRYQNNTLQTLLVKSSFNGSANTVAINDIEFDNHSSLFVGGTFNILPIVGVFGTNLSRYNLVSGALEPLAVLDQPVNTLIRHMNDIYIGGEFNTTNNTNIAHKYLAKTSNTASISDDETENKIIAFPNPFTNELTVENITDGSEFSIYNHIGQLVKTGLVSKEKINGLGNLPKGNYVVVIESYGSQERISVIK